MGSIRLRSLTIEPRRTFFETTFAPISTKSRDYPQVQSGLKACHRFSCGHATCKGLGNGAMSLPWYFQRGPDSSLGAGCWNLGRAKDPYAWGYDPKVN
ncbi:hypothetical protein MJO28_012917 [Puccinia striiformis f. sp. tritici]|uniref:Uncharacterized protein n=1 Tax=Puccinia striiformis f. sp. tritici TaxID=168172 RepID=A0ACC0DZR4_9BASI|nr:hypothetical protein MJO28_012917 [Puccinia striiformis f. sp. tritici]